MSSTQKTLPTGWDQILHDIHERVDNFLAAADARLARLPVIDTEQLVQERLQEAARLETCMQGLSAQLESAQRMAQEVDFVLQEGEHELHEQTTSCGIVRQKLAEWAGRAIG